ncbi:MAG TPA: glycosyltransferase family 2 protein [Phycisphaerae bacterium]|nr:glycosyltransferase family 2 protein [Phycisphaerae bacterium]
MPSDPTANIAVTDVNDSATEREPNRSVANLELSIILPTYNEADNVGELLRRIARVVTERSVRCEVLVMDDGSPDGTADAARQVDLPIPVRVVERTGRRGLSPAVIDGIALARGTYVLVMDADLQHPPESLTDLLQAMRDGAEFAIGSRYTAGGTSGEFGLYRRLNSRIATLLAAPLVKSRVRDPMAGFFCFRRDLADRQNLNPVGYKIGLEILVKCRPGRVVEVPIDFGPRQAGDSKMNLSQQFDYLRHLRRLYGWRWPQASQLILFCAVGGCGMVVDLTLMTLLVGAGLAFPLGRVLAIAAAMVFNFFLNRWITFPEAAGARCRPQLLRFIGVCSIGLCINWIVSNTLYLLLPSLRGLYQLYCVGGIVVATASNFLLSKYVAFRVPDDGTSR